MNNFVQAVDAIVTQTQANMHYIFIALAIMWGMFFLSKLSGGRLLILGITPRHPLGLLGIFCAPFLHANFNHIFFNSIPFFILSDFVLIEGLAHYLNVSLYIVVLSGLLTWLFARKAVHIGASSLITGYWSFLVMDAYSHGGIISLLLALVCVYYFAGIFFGIFPSGKGVSWEGHLFGLIAGVVVNYCLPLLPKLMVLH